MLDKCIAVSIIIEWENVLLSELGRCRRMLTQLASQTSEIVSTRNDADKVSPYCPFEVLVMINPDVVDIDEVRQVVNECLPDVKSVRSVKIKSAPGQSYYGLKNAGAELAGGEIIVFLDSDVIPDDGWLGRLLVLMREKELSVVGGNAYIEINNIFDKAFAVNWFFSLRQQHGRIEPSRGFFANNVAFKRSIFDHYRFVVDERTARGACVDMARRMLEGGVTIYRDSGAQVSHPPPNGLGHFIVRGIAHGRDALMAARNSDRRKKANIIYAFFRLLRNAGRSIRKVLSKRKDVNIRWFEVPVVMLIGIAYQLLVFIGESMTCLSPAYMGRHFKV